MVSKKYVKIAFCALMTLGSILSATDAEWTGAVDSDLNTAGNWVGDLVPNGMATFDSTYPFVNLEPGATGLFTIDTLYFPNSAEAFSFGFSGPGALQITGIGVSGANSDPSFFLINGVGMSTAQIFFSPNAGVTGASLGNPHIEVINNFESTISFLNAAQISLADFDAGLVAPITAGDNLELYMVNTGSLTGANEAGQLFMKGASFTVGDGLQFEAENIEGEVFTLLAIPARSCLIRHR